MMNPEEMQKLIGEIVDSGLQFLEIMRPMLDTLDGYKAELASRGYSAQAQEQMAVDLHHMMMTNNSKDEK